MKYFSFSANPLPAGIITADGQQQNVMVYTTSYQQVRKLACSLRPKTSQTWSFIYCLHQVSFNLNEDSTLFRHFEWCFYLRCRSRVCNSSSSPEGHMQKSTPNLHKSSLYTSTYKWRSWTVGSVRLVFSGPSSSALTGHRTGLVFMCAPCVSLHTHYDFKWLVCWVFVLHHTFGVLKGSGFKK